MSEQFSEQDIQNLFQQHLPPVELPPELASAVRARVMDEVAMTFKAEEVFVQATQQSRQPSTVLDSRRRTAQRSSAPRRSFVDTLNERFGWWRFATGLALAGATAAIVLFLVLALPGILPNSGSETTGTTASSGAAVLPVESAPAEAAQVTVEGGTATILRAGAVLGDIGPGGSAELYPGDGLVTLSGNAVIDYFDGQRTYLDADSRVELLVLTRDGEVTNTSLMLHFGEARNEVNTLGPNSRFEIKTPVAVARASAGSAFTVSVPSSKEQAQLQVTAGAVDVEMEGNALTLTAGQQVAAVPGQPLAAQNIEPAGGQSVAIAPPTETPVTEVLTPTPVPTYTPVPPTEAPTEPPTAEPVATNTPKPTATNTPEPTATDTPAPTATHTPLPTFTPTPTDTPEPRTVRLIVPQNGVSGGKEEVFQWEPDFQLGEDEAYELIFWKPGQDPLTQGFGLALPTTQTRLTVDLQALDNRLGGLLDPGEYLWGVRLVRKSNPNERLEFLGASRLFTYTTAITDGAAGGGSGE